MTAIHRLSFNLDADGFMVIRVLHDDATLAIHKPTTREEAAEILRELLLGEESRPS